METVDLRSGEEEMTSSLQERQSQDEYRRTQRQWWLIHEAIMLNNVLILLMGFDPYMFSIFLKVIFPRSLLLSTYILLSNFNCKLLFDY